jgi:membrane-associated protease RseP (regulator of RpoE activity)
MIPAAEEETALIPRKNRLLPHIILFILTLITTTLMGALFFSFPGEKSASGLILSGLPYSLTLLSILMSHEFGHYLAARSFGVRATYPYFIPFPSMIGTMGAVIKIRGAIPHQRALFYIGVMGPMPGFIASLAAMIYGVAISHIQKLPASAGDLIIFGDSLLLKLITFIFQGPIPEGYDIVLSPYAAAGWVGFLITGMNLLPMGQLDGGHILYALIGRKQRIVAWTALALLAGFSFLFPGWIIWIILTLTVLMVAHPPVPRGPELTTREKFLGWSCMAILLLTFIPVPVRNI